MNLRLLHYFIFLGVVLSRNVKWHHHKPTTEVYYNGTLPRLLNLNEMESPLVAKKDHLVENLPGLSYDLKMDHYAGFLPVSSNPTGGQLFYWYFDSMPLTSSSSVLFWLNGGPGCSSIEGLFSENGPFTFGKAKNGNGIELQENKYSWHKAARTVYVDQPVGTGYSHVGTGDYAENEDTVDEQFYTFLVNFFRVHSDLLVNNTDGTISTVPIYMSGESYAGRYIPTISAYMLKKNDEKSGPFFMNLTGIAIGNGWTDPRTQYAAADFALGTGLIDKQQANILRKQYELCLTELKNGKTYSSTCTSISEMLVQQAGVVGGYQLNMYDIRLYQKPGEIWPAPTQYLYEYMNRKDVRRALHTDMSLNEWTDCSDYVYDHLYLEDGITSVPSVVKVLNHSVNVLFYNGQFDLTCHHLGVERMLDELPWPGLQAYLRAPRSIWSLNNKPAGYVKQMASRQLTSIVVLGASHMVPYDQPEAALDMLLRFIKRESFDDYVQDFMFHSVMELAKTENIENSPSTESLRSSLQTHVMDEMSVRSMNPNNRNEEEENNELGMWTYVITFLLLIAFVFVVYKKRVFYRVNHDEQLGLRTIFDDIPRRKSNGHEKKKSRMNETSKLLPIGK